MSDHLSAFALDEVATDGGSPEAMAHLAECQPCRERLEAVRQQHQTLKGTREFQARFEAIAATTAKAAAPNPWPRRLAIVLPLAAALAVFILSPIGDDTRLKGAPTVELLAGERPTTQAKPGDRLTLAVGGAGHTHAAVFAIDAEAQLTVLWPPGDSTAAIAPGARVPLGQPFEVTAGDVVVIASFGDRARPVAELREALERAAAKAIAAGTTPLELGLPSTIEPAAKVRLEVGR